MALTQSHLYLALAVVFIAAFSLFYIFDQIGKISARCQAGEKLYICKQLSGFTLSMLIILLIISGFVLCILGVVYIIFSA
jgi:hypothetical protein